MCQLDVVIKILYLVYILYNQQCVRNIYQYNQRKILSIFLPLKLPFAKKFKFFFFTLNHIYRSSGPPDNLFCSRTGFSRCVLQLLSIESCYLFFSKEDCQNAFTIHIYLRSYIQYVLIRRATFEKTAILLRAAKNYCKFNDIF